jgi:hypothetical protein
MPRHINAIKDRKTLESHIRSIAECVGVKFDGASLNAWIRNKQHPDRKRIEQFGGKLFASIDPPWNADDWKHEQQPIMQELLAVTSLSPLAHHQERQPICLDSWVKHGLQVVSVNSSAEVALLRNRYPQVSRWVTCDKVGTTYKRPTQLINNMLRVALTLDSPILVVNSDIEIYGHQSRLRDLAISRSMAIGIRHNYETSALHAVREPYGLDAFLVYPETVKDVPKAIYSIGRPFWDYWLPWHMMRKGFELEWIGEPLFYHKSHQLNWSSDDWQIGYHWFVKHYKESINWEDWRKSMPFPPT